MNPDRTASQRPLSNGLGAVQTRPVGADPAAAPANGPDGAPSSQEYDSARSSAAPVSAVPLASCGPEAQPSSGEAVIPRGAFFMGAFMGPAECVIRIQGEFRGSIHHQGDVIVEEGAYLGGSVHARRLYIAGRVDAFGLDESVIAQGLEVTGTGHIQADVVVVASGALDCRPGAVMVTQGIQMIASDEVAERIADSIEHSRQHLDESFSQMQQIPRETSPQQDGHHPASQHYGADDGQVSQDMAQAEQGFAGDGFAGDDGSLTGNVAHHDIAHHDGSGTDESLNGHGQLPFDGADGASQESYLHEDAQGEHAQAYPSQAEYRDDGASVHQAPVSFTPTRATLPQASVSHRSFIAGLGQIPATAGEAVHVNRY